MFNFVYEPITGIGISFGFSMIGLYCFRFLYPLLAFDEDILFITLGLVYSSIIVIHGWRLDPILFFSQVLIISICTASGFAILRLRAMTYILYTELNLDIKDYKNSFLLWTIRIGENLKRKFKSRKF
jgi:hypothetical protein